MCFQTAVEVNTVKWSNTTADVMCRLHEYTFISGEYHARLIVVTLRSIIADLHIFQTVHASTNLNVPDMVIY